MDPASCNIFFSMFLVLAECWGYFRSEKAEGDLGARCLDIFLCDLTKLH